MWVQVKVELGHRAVFRKYPTAEGFTHDWTVFVRGPEGCNIQSFVDKVVFNLHESFPKAKRVVKDPPYQVSESGYGGFLMFIDIYFKNKEDPKKITFEYDLFLNVDNSPPINHVRCEKLKFQYPTEDFRRKLLAAGGECLPMPGEVAPATIQPSTPEGFNDLFGPPIKAETPKKHKHDKHKEKSSSSGSGGNGSGSSQNSTNSSSSSKHKAGKHPPGSSTSAQPATPTGREQMNLSHKDSHKSSSSSASVASHKEGSSSHKEHSSSHKDHKTKDKDVEKTTSSKEFKSASKRASDASPASSEGSKKMKTSSGSSSSSKSKSSSGSHSNSSNKDGGSKSGGKEKDPNRSKSSHKSHKKSDSENKGKDASDSRSSKSATTQFESKTKTESKAEALTMTENEPMLWEKSDGEADVMFSPSSSVSFSSAKAGGATLGNLIAELGEDSDEDNDLISPLPNNPSPASFFPSLNEKNESRTIPAVRPWAGQQPKIPSGKSMPDKSSSQKSNVSTPDSQKSGFESHVLEPQKVDLQKSDTSMSESQRSLESSGKSDVQKMNVSTGNGTKSKKSSSSSSSSKTKSSKDHKDKTKREKPHKDKKDRSKSETTKNTDTKQIKVAKPDDHQKQEVENECINKEHSKAPNGEDLSVLVEMQKKLLTMSNRQRLQEVVNLIEESGMYKISDTSFDFDLCMLDRHTVKRLQMCLEIKV